MNKKDRKLIDQAKAVIQVHHEQEERFRKMLDITFGKHNVMMAFIERFDEIREKK